MKVNLTPEKSLSTAPQPGEAVSARSLPEAGRAVASTGPGASATLKAVRGQRAVMFYAAVALGLVVLVGLLLVSLLVGSLENTLSEAFAVLPMAIADGWFGHALSSDDPVYLVIAGLRLPRTLAAVLCGGALGAAGALIQGHTNNKLADPGLLGINAGAALAVTLCAFIGLATSPTTFVFAAMIGSAVATTLMFALNSVTARRSSSAQGPLTLVIVGVALAALLSAVMHMLVLSNDDALDALRAWSTGSVAASSINVVRIALPIVLAAIVAAVMQGRVLNLLSLGVSTAIAMGINVTRARSFAIVTVALLGGAATALAGPISFIGLAAPHLVARVSGPNYPRLIFASALAGAILGIAADVLGRIIIRPGELGMGIVAAVIGAPLLIILARKGLIVSIASEGRRS